VTAIIDIRGLEIIDSRGNPTVAATVTLEGDASGYAAAPPAHRVSGSDACGPVRGSMSV